VKKYPIVHVKWIDACGDGCWGPIKRIESASKLVEVETIGFLVGGFEDRIVVSASVSDLDRFISSFQTV